MVNLTHFLSESVKVKAQLHDLVLQNQVTQSFKFAKGSANNVISAIRQFFYFTAYFKLVPIPATEITVTLFLEFMARSSGYGHIKHLLRSVKYLHEALNMPFRCTSFQIDTTLQGLKRRLARVPFQVLPITPEILRKMFSHLDVSRPRSLALWCSYLIAFYGLLRKANTVPKTQSGSENYALLRRNIHVDKENNMVYVYVGHSKTNNFCERDVVLPIPGNNDPALDPVRHLASLFEMVKCSTDRPAFSYSSNSFITYSMFTNTLKSLLQKVGLNPDLFSGHSFRRGGATFLHNAGGTSLMVKACGDWSSLCFTRYLYINESQRFTAQNRIRTAINHCL